MQENNTLTARRFAPCDQGRFSAVQACVIRDKRQNTPDSASPTFEKPDNLASDPRSNPYITEDDAPGDVWAATPDSNRDGQADFVGLFASLSTPGAEPTGLLFRSGEVPRVAYLNIQHPADGNSMTLIIAKQ